MIGLEIRFLARRYHGTGWTHAHNEGVVEWPPSPWRILRALVAASYELGLEPSGVERLLEKLRGLPTYRLPAARAAHTRHYMPDASNKRAKVFDSFVVVDGSHLAPGLVQVAWDVQLAPDERELLGRLAARITYLGRAESWAELSVIDEPGGPPDCWPDETTDGLDTTTLTALEPVHEFEQWASAQPKPKKKSATDVPRSLWDVLTFTGPRYRSEGWTRVPGTMLARYVFREAPFRRRASAQVVAPRDRRGPSVAQLILRSAVRPRIQQALSVAERVRASLIKIHDQGCPAFSGHFEVGAPSDHEHAFYLPQLDGSGQRIAQVVLSARMGFSATEIRALQQLRRVWGSDGFDIEIVLGGVWSGDDAHEIGPQVSPTLGVSRTWVTLTPFVPIRHPKVVRGAHVDGVAAQIEAECLRRVGQTPIEIEPFGDPARWARFQRRRRSGGGSRGPDRAYGARVKFAEPVRGPIAIGFGAHFGLGVFVPEEAAARHQ